MRFLNCFAPEDPVPEDVGEPDGHAEFKKVMNDPTHEDYGHFERWSELYGNQLEMHLIDWVNK